MGRGRYKLKRDLAAEEAQIQSASRKRGIWSSIGSTLGSVLAMAVTGGAAAPFVAAALAGGLSYAGGKIGSKLAKMSGAKFEGGKFFQSQKSSLERQIEDEIGSKAIKTAITSGMTKLAGAALKYGKEGFEVTAGGGKLAGETAKGGFKFGDLFGGKDDVTQEALAGQKGLGRALDFRGSFVGKGLGKMKAAKAAREFEALQEGMPPTYGEIDIDKILQEGKIQRSSAAVDEMLATRDVSTLGRGAQPSIEDIMSGDVPSGPGFDKGGILPGHSKIQYDLAQQRSAEISAGLKNYEFGGAYQTEGFRTDRASVPLAIEDEFSIEPGVFTEDIPDLEFSEFGQWEKPPPRPLTGDFQVTDPLSRMQTQIKNMPPSFKAGNLPVNYPQGDDPAFFDQQIYDVVTTPGTETIPATSTPNLPSRKDLSVQLMQRGEQGDQTYGVFNEATGQWEGALGAGRTGDATRADFLGGETGPYIKRPGDVFTDTSGTDYPRVNEYLQSDAYSQYLSDYEKTIPAGTPAIPGTDATTSLVPTDRISADMSQFPGRPSYIQEMPANLPQSFPVSSPNLMQNIGPQSQFNVASPDFVQPVGQSSRDLQESLRLGKKLNLYPRLFPGD